MYDFDTVIDRTGSGALKYTMMKELFGRSDLIPLWVADMEFATPPFILKALRDRLQHPIMGYTGLPDGYFNTVSDWIFKLHGWKADACHMRYIPGIVKGIGMVIEAFLKPGDKVIIQTPVYHPFRLVPQAKGHEVVYNPLVPVYDGDRIVTYRMDFDQLESVIDDSTRLLILCNPHNPAGICWSTDTLDRLSEITGRHDMIVLSDEIHGEMALFGHKHHPYTADNAITFMAPSKTFNIAGIVSSYVIIQNPDIRQRFFSYLDGAELDMADIFAPIATMAAYSEEGDVWRREMLHYVEGNVDFVDSWLRNNIPSVKCVRPEASFLVWLDCRELGLDQKSLVNLFVNGARLALNDGEMFSEQGIGFMRMNVGCPRSILATALQRLKNAIYERCS